MENWTFHIEGPDLSSLTGDLEKKIAKLSRYKKYSYDKSTVFVGEKWTFAGQYIVNIVIVYQLAPDRCQIEIMSGGEWNLLWNHQASMNRKVSLAITDICKTNGWKYTEEAAQS